MARSPSAFQVVLFALQVECLDHYPGMAADIGGILGDREAPLLFVGFTFGMDDHRVDGDDQVGRFLLAGDIDHYDPLVNPDLRRRQADTRRVVHGLRHVPDQFP